MKERWGISGSRGFIGSRLVSELKKDPKKEIVPMGRTDWLPPQLDYWIDTAAYGNMYGQTDAKEIYRANVGRVIALLDQAHGLKSIILTSTSSVDLPYQTLYSASKKAMEEIAQIYVRDSDMPITIVRPFSVYGIGEQKEHLIPKLIDSCLNGTEMLFVGEPKHDFIYIDDFVDGITRICSETITKEGQVCDMGSGKLTSNKEVKDIIERITKRVANTKEVDSMRKYDSKAWPTANHWTFCKTSLEEGIRRMVNEENK